MIVPTPAPNEPHEAHTPTSLGVRLDAGAAPPPAVMAALDASHTAALSCQGDVDRMLELARSLGRTAALPQRGNTLGRWQLLATLGAADLTAARIVEPHLDALAILAEAGCAELHADGRTWGVYAAQGPGPQLLARQNAGTWQLDGEKPWCSLADSLSHALITAQADDGARLFAIDLRDPGVASSGPPWTALGLPRVPSRRLSLTGVRALPVGRPGWYVQRPGFSWGGAGVAAVWQGAATSLARRLLQHCRSRKPDQIALWHLGRADQALWAARSVFQSAAGLADSMDAPMGEASRDAALAAGRVRAAAVGAAETVKAVAAHGMGPEPLAFEQGHAQRVADLELYMRQDHAERSVAAHGAMILAAMGAGTPPW
ncbi:acyl-CoA dehydrogenase family protein [Arthrobacter sp. STN4]|uniref:acyl-CoA dehydrogenase family protein n=1 Tax=Arthrobacter sp. STN4 TaxID=2923276 RepID=UPI00211A1D05|nr:acyl-CoA dehydrogenase family protein [Arthrobacter sp. STN4]MCQ9165993.1 acyl-CoA/acyl-ACP dehydrogenase [Arthrobacter sp. STN4]